MSDIPAKLHASVVERAAHRCEYCTLSQVGQEASFHVDHVKPRASGGLTMLENLALVCVSCSLRKGAKETADDPDSGDAVPLFNPRLEKWSEHFTWNGALAVGSTPAGRATVNALAMNRPLIIAIRQEEIARGRHP